MKHNKIVPMRTYLNDVGDVGTVYLTKNGITHGVGVYFYKDDDREKMKRKFEMLFEVIMRVK